MRRSQTGSTSDLDTGAAQSLPAVAAIPVYACRLRDGVVWVDAEAQLNDAQVPGH